MSDNGRMTKSEREDLQRLVRQREKVLKSAAKQRSTELLADFENQLGAVYMPEDDPVWEKAVEAAQRDIDKAQRAIKETSRALGIPDEFAPSIRVSWNHRGYGNGIG